MVQIPESVDGLQVSFAVPIGCTVLEGDGRLSATSAFSWTRGLLFP